MKLILTDREKQILYLLKDGCPDKEIALKLDISLYTVKSHLKQIRDKLNAKSSLHAIVLAYDYGLLKPSPGVFDYGWKSAHS